MTTKSELIMVDSWNGRCDINVCDKKSSNKKQKKELYAIASKELRENENARKECVAHLRNWINQHPDIENCLTDDIFLLRFLRVKKFSLNMAEQTLLKYLNFRRRFKHFMYNLDCSDPNVTEIINNEFLFVSPFRDSSGKRVIIYNIGNFNLQKFNGTDLAKTFALTYETLLDDEENQILGVAHVVNLAGTNLNFIPLFTATEFYILGRWGEQSIPMRHKQVDVLNTPAMVKYVVDISLSIASDKLKSRVKVESKFMKKHSGVDCPYKIVMDLSNVKIPGYHRQKMHSSIDQLHSRVDKQCLPLELGGEMPAKEMVKLWKSELETKKKRLLSFDDMNLLSDRGIIRRKNPDPVDGTGVGSLAGSFRKLEFD